MKRWQEWTEEQEEVLKEHGRYGAEECARIIKREFGIERSPEAVRRHAYRAGIPIIKYRVCHSCGGKARKLDKEGLCPACHYKHLAERQKLSNIALLKEIKQSESGEEYNRSRRDYDKERQDKHRFRKKSCGD